MQVSSLKDDEILLRNMSKEEQRMWLNIWLSKSKSHQPCSFKIGGLDCLASCVMPGVPAWV